MPRILVLIDGLFVENPEFTGLVVELELQLRDDPPELIRPFVPPEGFGAYIPNACPFGCHRLHLTHDGVEIDVVRVRTEDDTKVAIAAWQRKYGIPRQRFRSMKRYMVLRTRALNDELAKARSAAAAG